MQQLHETDAELAARAGRGDAGAFETLVARYGAAMGALAYDRLGHIGSARRAVETAFHQAHERLGELKTPEDRARFGAWLYVMLREICALKLEGRGSERRIVKARAEKRAGEASLQGLGQIPLDTRQDALRAAVEDLAAPLRELVVLRYLGGASRELAAAILEMDLETLDARQARALKELGRSLRNGPGNNATRVKNDRT